MSYLTLKALHIIFVVTWFAGLFYIVRLFIYHVEAEEKDEQVKTILQDQFKVMERRLWYGITWPSCILAMIFGGILTSRFLPLTSHPWLLAKLCFVFLLFGYHQYCGSIYLKLKRGQKTLTSSQLRIFNEVATLFLFTIVFLVELKNILKAGYGVLGLVVLSIVLFISIKIYRRIRA